MEDRPKGRGAVLLKLLKEKAVGQPKPEETPAPTEPPRPRGRAALLHQLQQNRLKSVGAASTSTAVTASSSSEATSGLTASKVQDVITQISELSFVEKDVVKYKGEAGKSINVSANYIKLHVEKERGVYEYEVKFDPELDAKNKRIKMVNIIMREMGSAKVFDGGNVLYLPQKITDTSKTFRETLPGPDGDQEISTTIIYKRKKSMGERECIPHYKVLFKRIMHILLYTQMGKNYFDTEHKYLIPQHKLEVFPGFAITVDELEDGLLLCLDTQHRVLRTQNAYELLNELRCSDPRRFKELATANIIGSCIFTRYNNKTYTVDDIAWDMSPVDTFPTRDGKSISFVDYYKQQYNIVIRDVTQPLLINRKNLKVSGSSEKVERMVCLIPELSFLTGLTDTMRSDFRVMKDVAQYTRVTPHQRMAALRTYLSSVKNSEKAQQILNEWGLRIDGGTIDMRARQLDNETIWFGGDQTHRTNNNADWTRAVGENQVTGPVDMINWIVFHTERDTKYAKDFSDTMTRLGGVMGCTIAYPRIIKLADDRTETYMNACRQYIAKEVQIVVFICPSMRSDRYAVIKKICCTQIPVASQVINSRTLSNPQKVRAIIQKIALQMTCKLGGTLWTVRFPFKGWMICGIDVYHGSKDSSVCGFVASLNESISRWFSLALFQSQELGDFYKLAFTKAVETWRNENGYYPSKVVIIRDGVGDGQLEHCRRYEIEQFESCLKEFELETKLCFIVVQKRINTRIFALGRESAENPPPGTVLDHTVTRRYMQDFFLVPQNVRQGTVNPTHYIVLHDTCNLKPDHTQRLCYKLCHLYYNWSGTIRVPAPCQYAHKLAALVGQHIKKAPSASLADKLFYL
ncbi:piwi-like protein Ago3 [Anoplophora glabripennis]|nr:piwi-like protein Ago3 [Anoplophora glabripennis]